MSKRKNRKQRSRPNLPEETLARARRDAGLEPEAVEAEVVETREAAIEAAPKPAPVVRQQSSLPPIERRRSSSRRRESKPEQMTHAEIAERLSNPTREVSTDQLRAQYGYVLTDLRSMGLLAAVLFIAMIAAARFL
jgi:hypothetical protein